MLKLLLLLLALEAPQDNRGSAPPPTSSIRMSPRSDIRSGEKTVEAAWGSSSSTKLSASRPGEGVTREVEEEEGEAEEKGWESGGDNMARGSREEDEVEEDVAETVLRRAWTSSSWEGQRESERLRNDKQREAQPSSQPGKAETVAVFPI